MKLGNRRLLKLADILDKADAEHEMKGEPTYDQERYTHDCGTPACALGHWAAHNKKRWYFDSWGYPALTLTGEFQESHNFGRYAAMHEFGLTLPEANKLFESGGCGGAKTAKQAAKYIRQFVKRRS